MPGGLGRRLRGAILAAGAILAPAAASAHQTSLAAAELRVEGPEARLALRLSAHDLAVALGIDADLKTPVPVATLRSGEAAFHEYLRGRLRVTSEAGPCPAETRMDYRAPSEAVVVDAVFRCPAPIRRLTLDYLLFFEIDPQHRAVGRVDLAGRAPAEFLLDRTLPSLTVTVDRPAPRSWKRFGRLLALGAEHILVGLDHVLFVIVLVVADPRFWPVARVVTAFTVAHSLTLGLAWYGLIDLPSRWVEVAIAASIVWVSAENLLRREPMRRRWLLAGGFGLVHGLGFYGVLHDLDVAGASAALTLLGFNLGVEAGQLAIVAVLLGPLLLAQRRGWLLPAMRAASAAVLLIGLWWIVERSVMA